MLSTMPIIATNTNSPMIAGMKYWSATDGVVKAGATVDSGSVTVKMLQLTMG